MRYRAIAMISVTMSGVFDANCVLDANELLM